MKKPNYIFETNVSNKDARSDIPKIMVAHTTEGPNKKGLDDVKGISSYFDNPSVQASSTIVTDGEGNTARLMPDSAKPWTQASYNSVSLSIENIGYASTTRNEWFKLYHNQLKANAYQFAYWSHLHKIPLRRAVTLFGGVQRTGIASHKQLGSYGGGHSDPGRGYPFKYVIWLARYYKLKATRPNSKAFRKAKKKVNNIRKHYRIAPVK